MTKSDACDAKKMAVPAKSLGNPHLSAGVRDWTSWYLSGNACLNWSVISVTIHPGSMAFACTLCFAQATAHDFVYWTTPPFDAAYAAAYAVPKIDIMDPMLMYLPAPLSRMWSNVSDDTLCIEVRFVSMTNRQSSSGRF